MFDDRNDGVFVPRLVLFVLVGVDVPRRFLRVGLDRFAILKYGIDDIRDFYTNDVRFLEQFRKEEK